MSKAILISIDPEWCRLIASREKTVEVRKTRPKIKTPFKCYIYCTLPKRSGDIYLTGNRNPVQGNGKIIGEFICGRIIEFPYNANGYGVKAEKTLCTLSGVPVKELYHYLQGKKPYGWHISNLKIYDNPREISRFGLKRAPQSWCYVEV